MLFILNILVSLFIVDSFASSSDIHVHKMEKGVKACPEKPLEIAKEVIKLELLGKRSINSNPKCFEEATNKYYAASKNPDNKAANVFIVKENGIKITSLKYNKDYFNYEILFEAEGADGKTKNDKISFMLNAKLGEKIPDISCASVSAEPDTAYVSQKCINEK